MKTILIPVAFLAALLMSHTLVAQEFDQYGLRSDRSSQQTQANNTGLFNLRPKAEASKPGPLSGLFKRSESNQPMLGQSEPKFSLPKLTMPKLEMPKLTMPKFEWPKMNAEGGLFKRPSWLPVRDPNAPSLLEKMNAKSKSFIDRTTGWMAGKSADFSEKRTASWDTIRRDMERIKSNAGDPNLTPPTRSAQSTTPRMRY